MCCKPDTQSSTTLIERILYFVQTTSFVCIVRFCCFGFELLIVCTITNYIICQQAHAKVYRVLWCVYKKAPMFGFYIILFFNFYGIVSIDYILVSTFTPHMQFLNILNTCKSYKKLYFFNWLEIL